MPEPRLPRPVDPIGRSPLGRRWARRRYERRWGFLPFEGREDLPATGRTVLYRVEWGRHGFDVCVMLARWEHAAVYPDADARQAWRRREVVAHEWIDRHDDGTALGAARFELGALGERLEEEADDARLAGQLLEPLREIEVDRPFDMPREGADPEGTGFMALFCAAFFAFGLWSVLFSHDPNADEGYIPLVFGGLLTPPSISMWLAQRRTDRAAPEGFQPSERRSKLPRSGRRTLYRVDVGRRDGASCVMVARWHYRRNRWRRDEVVEHVWVSKDDEREARRRLEIRARALERADADDYVEPDRRALRYKTPLFQHYTDAAVEAELATLQDELDATADLVEDLAEDPR